MNYFLAKTDPETSRSMTSSGKGAPCGTGLRTRRRSKPLVPCVQATESLFITAEGRRKAARVLWG